MALTYEVDPNVQDRLANSELSGITSTTSVPSPPVTSSGGGAALLPEQMNQDKADIEKDPPLTNFDPDQPIMAIEDTLHGYNPADKMTVAGQMEGLLSENSDYLKRARNRAIQTANQRGLLNTTMAAQAGEAAAIDSALNIASQDAGLFGDIYKQKLGHQQQQELSRQGYQQTRGLNQQQNQLQQRLNEQLHAMDTQTKTMVHGFTKELENMQHGFSLELDKLNYSQELEGALLQTMQNMIVNGQQMMTELAVNKEATKKEADAIRESILNGLKTFTNIWKVPSGSTEIFDFSGIV